MHLYIGYNVLLHCDLQEGRKRILTIATYSSKRIKLILDF